MKGFLRTKVATLSKIVSYRLHLIDYLCSQKTNMTMRQLFLTTALFLLTGLLGSRANDMLAQPVDAQATTEAKALYQLLLSNYGQQPLTCSMANPVWDYQMATDVHTLTDKWPAIHCFDLMHLCYSPTDWINYENITPVQEWHQQGGYVSLMWHWQVPASSTDAAKQSVQERGYTSTASETTFDPTNLQTSGSWEHTLFYQDLWEACTVLKALQDAGIAVLWRPFHEASGNVCNPQGGQAWFWWGKGGPEVFKDLWHRMYDYFQQQNIHNLLWVWTSCFTDSDWYPGDAYVDIVGTDIYNEKDPAVITQRFQDLTQRYPSRMVALTECGNVPYLSTMWEEGALWSWVMPWYGNSGDDTPWVSDRWWKDAVKQYTPSGITAPRPSAAFGTSVRYYTLDGRPASPHHRGPVIKVGR